MPPADIVISCENNITSDNIVNSDAMAATRDLLLHPIRLRIVQTLVGSQLTPQQLHRRLGDVPQATLYRQIGLLVDGGLIEVVAERQVRGTVERTYAVVAHAVSLGGEDLTGTSSDDHFRYFATFVGTLLADFATYLEQETIDFEQDRVGYRQVPLLLSDEEVDELAGEIGDSIRKRLSNEPSPERKRRLLSTIVLPGDGH